MAIDKRNALTAQSALYVPLALDKLTSAAQSLRDNKADDALQQIMDAQVHLEQLVPVFEAACDEAKAEHQT